MTAEPDYFTFAELRALPDCSGSTFTDEQIAAAAAYFVAIVEREVAAPFIPRTFVETFSGPARTLTLSQPHVRSLTTVTVNGSSVSTGSLLYTRGILRYADGFTFWPYSVEAIVVTYVGGEFATCPGDIKDATLWATRDRLLSQSDLSGVDVRRTSVNTDFGTTNYILPGEKRPTGYPDLDAAIAGRVRSTANLGFA